MSLCSHHNFQGPRKKTLVTFPESLLTPPPVNLTRVFFQPFLHNHLFPKTSFFSRNILRYSVNKSTEWNYKDNCFLGKALKWTIFIEKVFFYKDNFFMFHFLKNHVLFFFMSSLLVPRYGIYCWPINNMCCSLQHNMMLYILRQRSPRTFSWEKE